MPAAPSPTEQLAAMLSANNSAALPPVPDASEGNPLARWFSNGGVAGMLGMTPAYQQIAENQASADAAPDLKSKLAILLQNPVAGALGVDAPIRAYHGSPYSFDKFDLSKIGTGEGAQIYGHGLYFAGNEDVARSYRENVIDKSYFDDVNSRLRDLSRQMDQYSTGQYRQFRDPRGYELANEYDSLMAERASKKGHMYEVALHADPASLLDWDKPLGAQNPQVQGLVEQNARRVLDSSGFGGTRNQAKDAILALQSGNMTGQGAYRSLAMGQSKLGNLPNPATASEVLSQAGIPGIQYLDAGSRASGDGTRNYVMFDPARIEIMRKYGLLAGMLGGGAAAAGGDQQ